MLWDVLRRQFEIGSSNGDLLRLADFEDQLPTRRRIDILIISVSDIRYGYIITLNVQPSCLDGVPGNPIRTRLDRRIHFAEETSLTGQVKYSRAMDYDADSRIKFANCFSSLSFRSEINQYSMPAVRQ